MDHETFVAAYRLRVFQVRVNKKIAELLKEKEVVPWRYRAATSFWTWVGTVAVLIGLLLLSEGQVLAGIITAAAGGVTVSVSFSTWEDFLIQHAVESPDFFKTAWDCGLLLFLPGHPICPPEVTEAILVKMKAAMGRERLGLRR